jgi:hypothetical protein
MSEVLSADVLMKNPRGELPNSSSSASLKVLDFITSKNPTRSTTIKQYFPLEKSTEMAGA